MKKFKLILSMVCILIFASSIKAQYTDVDLQNAINAAAPGATITLNAGTYVFGAVVNVNKTGIKLLGNSTIFSVSGTGERLNISASGVTIESVDILKTDKTGLQNIIYIGASNTTIKNNTIHGQFVIGDGDVSRAMVVAGGLSGLLIDGNTFYALRQPGYFSGPTTGIISNNYTYGTKGWVMEGGDMTFAGNTWGTNVYDIAILSAAPPTAYTDIVAMSNANNGAVIEDQRVAPAVLSVVYVDASTAFSSDLGGKYHPYSTITPAITRVVSGGKILVAAGTYNESLDISKALTILGAGQLTTFIDQSGNAAAGTVITIHNLSGNVTFDGFTVKTGPASIVASNGIHINNLTGPGTITISNNVIWGVQSATQTAQINFGLIAGYFTATTPKLVFDHNVVHGGSDNPILIEKWMGPTEITNNTLYQNPLKDFSTSDVIFMMNYGGSHNTQKQLISGNTIDMGWGTTNQRGAGISIASSYTGGTALGGFTNVEIKNNNFINLKPNRRGPGLWNNSSDGTGGDITNAVISGNTFSNAIGYVGEYGIRILGKATGTQIHNNIISGVTDAVKIQPWNGHEPSGTAVHNNSLLGVVKGCNNLSSVLVNAELNWWGTAVEAGIIAKINGLVDYDPWIGKAEMVNVTQLMPVVYDFPIAGVKMVFSTLPLGGGSVTVTRYNEAPTPFPSSYTNVGMWLDITSTMPNYSFDVTIKVDVAGLGFDGTQSVMYKNSAGNWLAVPGGTYLASDPMFGGHPSFSFVTNHFTPFTFINTPATAYNVYLSSSTSAAVGFIYPSDSWGTTGYEPNDWDFTAPISLYIVPQVGSIFGASDITIQWDNTMFSYVGVDKAGGIYDNPAFQFLYNQLGTTNLVTINASRTDNTNFPPTSSGQYIAKLNLNLTKPGFGPVSFAGLDFRAFDGLGGQLGVLCNW